MKRKKNREVKLERKDAQLYKLTKKNENECVIKLASNDKVDYLYCVSMYSYIIGVFITTMMCVLVMM